MLTIPGVRSLGRALGLAYLHGGGVPVEGVVIGDGVPGHDRATDLLLGYDTAFGVLAAIQAIVVCATGFLVLGLNLAHGVWLVGLLAICNAFLGMALELFASAFARTEFQAVQLMPAVIMPQPFLCGLSIARDQMAHLL